MPNQQIQNDIIGRVRNTRLSRPQAVIALFEAVVNSLQAIEDAGRPGYIHVDILRASQPPLADQGIAPVTGFEVADNGIGYNDTQYESFCTANSRLKVARGGKGIGRFLWLKTFREVSIASTYAGNGEMLRRSFDFAAADPPIRNLQVAPCAGDPRTVVALRGINPGYEGFFPQSAAALADRLARHFLVPLMRPSCPQISVIDKDAGTLIDVRKRLQEGILLADVRDSFQLKDESFELTLVHLRAANEVAHKLVLCADAREVAAYPLHVLVPDLKGRAVAAPDGQASEVWAVVCSDYLNRRVNQERTAFMLADSESADVDALDLTQKELHSAIALSCSGLLKDFLEHLGQEKLRRVERFAMDEGPEYRMLLKHAPQAVKRIPADLPDQRLDAELHRILLGVELELREEGRLLLEERPEPSIQDEGYIERYERYVDKLLDYRQSELARYVIHRRSILDLLANALTLKPNGRFFLEDHIHKLLYPPRSTSDGGDYGQQNLWLIDERLNYHYFLASDMELSNLKVLDSDSHGRPDILIFDRPSAFVEGAFPFQSITIIELKRPQRASYSGDEKDPCQQVYDYIEHIRAGKVIGEDGQYLHVDEKTRFYCYILADLTSKLRRLAMRNEFIQTADGMGYFKHSQNYNAYVEIISYRKMLEDARRRNRVLFQKLALPPYRWGE